MPDVDLDTLTVAELKTLHKSIVKAIAEYDSRKKVEARAAVEAYAKELGFSLSELINVDAPKTRAAAAPKYRHPDNELITWSGRGRKPTWFAQALADGRSPGSLAV